MIRMRWCRWSPSLTASSSSSPAAMAGTARGCRRGMSAKARPKSSRRCEMARVRVAAALTSTAATLLCGLTLTAAPVYLHAQTYPVRAVRMVVPFPPGGGTDVIGRLIAQKLTGALGQQVIVDNRAGAAGRLGTDYAAHATPDGYTLLMTTTTTIIT